MIRERKWGNRRLVELKEAPSATPSAGNANGPGGLFSHPALEKNLSGRKDQTSAKPFIRRKHQTDRYRRRKASVVYKEGQGHTSAMVAFYLSPMAASEVSQASVDLFAEKAENRGDLHITLAYLGKVIDLESKLPVLVPIIQRYVQIWLEKVGLPITAVLGSYSAFPNEEDGVVPIYRKVESPLIHLWVDGLRRVLDFAGITAHREYETYTPHVTVAYTYPEIVELLGSTPATPIPVQFDRVVLALGDHQIEMPLATSCYKELPITLKASQQISPGVYRISGNLCQVHGKFGPCDSATSEGFGKKPPKGKKGKGGGAGKKPKLSDADKAAKRKADIAQHAQEAEAQRVQNRTNSLAKLTNRPNDQAMAVLDSLAKGGTGDQAMLESMTKTGLVEKHADGSYTLSTHGHGLLSALDKGDAGRAAEAIAGGGDKVSATTDRANAKAQALADRNATKVQREADKKKRDADREKRHQDTAKRRADNKNKGDGKKKPSTPAKRNETPPDPRDKPGAAINHSSPAPITPVSPKPVPAPQPAPAPGKVREPIQVRNPGRIVPVPKKQRQ